MKKWIDRMIWKSHCLLFGHKWANDRLGDKDGWVPQSCKCGAKRFYNTITKEEKKRRYGMKKWIDRMIWKSHCLLFGHKWSNDRLGDKDGWVPQSCECGAKRMYNTITKEEKK